ncbi:hypothetical protein [Streptomyces sp. H27-C3]|uniref:hypothetical protein n=1 Tax=Streptomyces sp. H27-C3 TaxID=3046305 RepID=UPI0024BBAD1D|nr:hypothetical protein [Streptomyces sp. H27-C3]MDJ0460718.1 hypothetical protein [Streptomyces sp. H27-C3]
MRGDETPLTSAGDGIRERSGPRHAAPRKSLLAKWQMPAGKAMALAAMPTAVFVGMGLTPKLALADEQPTNPFAPGPCVTRSDAPDPDASESKSPSAKPSATATPSPSASTPEEIPTPDASASSSGAADPAKEPEAGRTAKPPVTKVPDAKPTPSATPSPSKTSNPLDPLGVGDAINDLLDGPDDDEKAMETPAPEGSEPSGKETTGTAKPSAKPSTNPDAGEKDEAKGDAEDPIGDAADKAADRTKDAIKDAADEAGAKVEELDAAAKDAAAKADAPAKDANGKERFPCPTADPEALAAADLEPGIPNLPDDPWILESSMLTLRGLDYKGIVEVRTYNGKIKKVLKFTAEETDIKDLHQTVVGPGGTTTHVEGAGGSTSTLRDSTVTMYTEELKGNLFGLIPITFSPETPPPLNVPIAMFTKVKVTQAGQFGGTLTVPGMNNYIKSPGA